MEIKDVIGDNSPEKFESLQGGTLINAEVQEVTEGESTKYKYKQTFVTETNEEKLEMLFNLFTIKICKQYLASTDWVNSYKLRHDLGLEVIPEESSKWKIIKQREAYIEFIKASQVKGV